LSFQKNTENTAVFSVSVFYRKNTGGTLPFDFLKIGNFSVAVSYRSTYTGKTHLNNTNGKSTSKNNFSNSTNIFNSPSDAALFLNVFCRKVGFTNFV